MSKKTSSVRMIPAKAKKSRITDKSSKDKKRIGVYVRVSTDSAEQEKSYDLQVNYFKELVDKNPDWELVEIFADHGLSGTSTKKRVAFNRMMERCQNKEIDYIITKSISRFARNTLLALQSIRLLKSIGVGVWFQKENIDTLDGKGELFLTILSSMAQEESRSISTNTKWAISKKFQAGDIHMPTTYFLGYDTDESGNVVINDEQAEVVRRIYKEFLAGKGTPTIAKRLSKEGVPTARGNKHWTSYAVYQILNQEKYMGHCLAQKSVTIDFLTKKRVVNKDIEPQYFVKNTHPAIISEDVWNLVQQELKRRRKMRTDPDNKYRQCFSGKSVFSNKLFCAECGRPVLRRRLTSTKNKEKYRFTAWQCRVAAHKDPDFKDCNCRYVWEEELEKGFMKTLYEMKKNKNEVKEDVKKAIEQKALSKKEQARLKELENQLEALNNRASMIAEKETATNDKIYQATLEHLTYEREILETEYEQLSENNEERLFLEKQLDELLKMLDSLGNDSKFRDDIFVKTVEKGVLNNSQIVSFEFKCGISREAEATKKK
ncbi:recombinase family protein [Proteinivorax tanatarense]|uniref:Recombinase family protein n=1 Tax=Proteinivorax tanatarense TaxID=1260629 RepID=A0AAU7VH28_9FIRM